MRVAFFDNRIDIESTGFLLPGMTVQDMHSGVSRIRKPVVARVFRVLNLTEPWGSGVKRIFVEATAQGLSEPRVVEMATGVRLSIGQARAHTEGGNTSASSLTPAVTPAATPSVGSRLESRLELQLESKLAAKMVALLQTQESGKAALSQAFGHRSVSCEPHKQIRRLLDMGQVAMPLPDKPQSRLQRYRLTPQGQALLAALTSKAPPAP